MAALRLRPLLLLTLATLTAPAGGLLTSRRGAAPSSPFRNLRVEPEQRRLSWDRVTSGPGAVCRQDGRSPVREEAPGRNRCDFRLPLSRCRVTNFSVSLGDADAAAAWVLFPPLPAGPGPAPGPAPAVRGLRCRLHDAVRMTCRWGRGPGAPGGARFRMFWGDARQGRAGDRECPRYLQDEGGGGGGGVTGCVVDDVTALGLLPEHVAVTVTAEGADVTPGPAHDRKWPWPCDDLIVDLDRDEDLATPTLTATCNGSEARVRWEVRSLFPRVFRYRLEVHKSSQAEPEVLTTDVTQHRVPHAGAASFRVRAGLKYDVSRTSGWSRAAAVDCGPREAGAPPEVTVGSAAAAAAGAGLVVLGTAVLLCRRPLKAKLLPRIPRMKDPVGAAPGETVAWAAAPEDCPVTLVTEA